MSKRLFFIVLFVLLLAAAPQVKAQCAICTRTAQQLGEKPALALNKGIIYLAAAPLAIFCVIGYRWWKNYRDFE
jgi:hypothetical protein